MISLIKIGPFLPNSEQGLEITENIKNYKGNDCQPKTRAKAPVELGRDLIHLYASPLLLRTLLY